jgi:hypothetical protein
VLALLLTLATEVVDVRESTTGWIEPYNQALDLLSEDPEQALVFAQRAVALAPNHRLDDALSAQAMAGAAAGDPVAEADALDGLMALDTGRWELFWNGTLDCMAADMDASAYRFAHYTLERSPSDPAAVAAVAFQLALQFDQLDQAAADLALLQDPGAQAQLVTALQRAGRCADAPTLVGAPCP